MAAESRSRLDSGLRGLGSTPIQAVGLLAVALLAIFAAFLKIAIGLAHHKGWDWIGFWQDVVQFAVIAAIVTAVSAGINAWAIRRQHEGLIFRSIPIVLIAFHGPDAAIFRIAPSDTAKKKQEFLDTASKIIDKVPESMTQLASWLNELVEQYKGPALPTSATFAPIMNQVIKALWAEFSRVIKLSHDNLNLRGQRRTLLSYLVDDLAQIVSADNDLTAAAIKVRDRAVEYLALVQQTDAAIESDFVLNSSSSHLWSATAPGAMSYHVNMSTLSSTSDRVAFLIAYIDERLHGASGAVLSGLVPYLQSSFSAFSRELCAAGDLAVAFSALTNQAMRSNARPVP